MKRFLAIFAAGLCLGATTIVAQETTPVPVPSPVTSAHYELTSALPAADAQAIVKELDLRFEAWNHLFRFDASTLAKLKVRTFTQKIDFDAYLTGALGSTRDGDTYLHYSTPGKSELVLLRDGSDASRSFAHQAFIQYLRAFIPNPPTWIREGFAIYFEALTLNKTSGELAYEENLAWLDTVKAWGSATPDIASILRSDMPAGAAPIEATKLSPASWALASFLLNTDNDDYRRSLYEGILLLSPTASPAENASVVAARFDNYAEQAQLQKDFSDYLASRHTFNELIDLGRKAYTDKKYDEAVLSFMEAATVKPQHYAPHYYLGLVAYEQKNYTVSDSEYKAALERGADEALISWAQGITAIADKRIEAAKAALLKAKSLAPARYGAKADELLAKLK